MSDSDSEPPPETGIQAERPKANAATGIQARLSEGPLPPGFQEPAFLARLKNMLELHGVLTMNRPKPPMWGAVQIGFVLLAAVVAFSTFHAMMSVPAPKGAAANNREDMAGVVFLFMFFLICVAPDALLWLSRRSQRAIARQSLWQSIKSMVRTFPAEIDHCGGVEILGDKVELEALVHILDQRFGAGRLKGWPGT
jgi:hypothetical protein